MKILNTPQGRVIKSTDDPILEFEAKTNYLNIKTNKVCIEIVGRRAKITAGNQQEYSGSIIITDIEKFDGYVIYIDKGLLYDVSKFTKNQSTDCTISYLLNNEEILLHFEENFDEFVANDITLSIDKKSSKVKMTTLF